MYTGRFSLFFSFYVSEMGDVKALISHQMFGAKEILTACDYLTLCKTQVRFAGFSKSILSDKPYSETEVGGNGVYMYVCGGGHASRGG